MQTTKTTLSKSIVLIEIKLYYLPTILPYNIRRRPTTSRRVHTLWSLCFARHKCAKSRSEIHTFQAITGIHLGKPKLFAKYWLCFSAHATNLQTKKKLDDSQRFISVAARISLCLPLPLVHPKTTRCCRNFRIDCKFAKQKFVSMICVDFGKCVRACIWFSGRRRLAFRAGMKYIFHGCFTNRTAILLECFIARISFGLRHTHTHIYIASINGERGFGVAIYSFEGKLVLGRGLTIRWEDRRLPGTPSVWWLLKYMKDKHWASNVFCRLFKTISGDGEDACGLWFVGKRDLNDLALGIV